MAFRDDHDEIWRMRDRLHTLEGTSAAFRERLLHVEQRLDKVEPSVEALQRQDELAEAVAEKMKEHRGEMFTVTQKLGAAIVGAVAIADFVRGLVLH